MKIERLNENQIRCTLTPSDLQERGLKLSELAYGTDKAKELFRDMMEQALYRFGFRAENTPLMIEAIPMESGTIVLVVTKVSNPDELDARFSSFAPSVQAGASQEDSVPSVFEQLMNTVRAAAGMADGETAQGEESGGTGSANVRRNLRGLSPQDVKAYQSFLMTHRMFTFPSVSDAARAARRVASAYTGESALFVDDDTHTYYLFLSMKNTEEVEALQPQLATLTEYGRAYLAPYARMEFIREHCRTVIKEDALAALSEL